jgi:hypothetical protein
MDSGGNYYEPSHLEAHPSMSSEHVMLNLLPPSTSNDTDQLYRTNLVTREQSSYRVPLYTFNESCCWSEVLGGSLLIIDGGGLHVVR